MNYVSDIEGKIELIQNKFAGLVGGIVQSYELAQMWCDEKQEWDNWMDIPLFLTIDKITLSISWNQFDELNIEMGRILPFSLGGCIRVYRDEFTACLGDDSAIIFVLCLAAGNLGNSCLCVISLLFEFLCVTQRLLCEPLCSLTISNKTMVLNEIPACEGMTEYLKCSIKIFAYLRFFFAPFALRF